MQPVDPLESVGVAAVRGDRPRRRDLRARRRRRQGPGLHALQGHRGAPQAERPPAGEHQVHHRRRRGSRQHAPRRLHPRPQARAAAPTSSSSPTRRCSPAACRRSATACAASSTSRSICAAAAPICTPASFGGAVANPAFVLAQMIAQMKDRGGRIKIPGFYDDVRPLQDEERQAWAQLPFNEKKYRKDFGIPKAVRRDRVHDARAHLGAADARGERPAVGLHRRRREDRAAGGRHGQDQHAAGARIRIRTRSPTCSRSTCEKIAPKTVELKFTRMHGGKPWMASFDNPFMQAAGRAIEKGFGRDAGLHARGRLDSGRLDVPGGTRRAVGAVRRRPARRKCARPEREARSRRTSTTASSRRRICTTRSHAVVNAASR